DTINELHRHDIEVSLFVDPVPEQIEAAHDIAADKIELHTGEYANARSEQQQRELLEGIQSAARLAQELDLGINAGHGLNYLNILPVKTVMEIEEVSIGHAILSRALFVGLERAVREMREILL
ncbi:MAG: pyridoxine 5'-phosphate synthase, partial [Bacteroidetes bacterium]|nr:pyridoxine 5'-phosphate synthase [Bacteroidota bacterium]